MRKWFVFVFFLTACHESIRPEPTSVSTPKSAPSIVGGHEVSFDDPIAQKAFWLRSFYDRQVRNMGETSQTTYKVLTCTASAISPRILLTAAHCVVKNAETIRLEVPVSEHETAHINVIKTEVHPDYPKDKNADLALMLLETALPEAVSPLLLPERDKDLKLKVVTVAGFGRHAGRKSVPSLMGILRSTELNVLSYSTQKPTFIVDQSLGKGFCQGDSGGPAILDIEGESFVVGVASKTLYFIEDLDPDLCNYKGEYINVQYHLDWIQKTFNTLSLH